VREEDQYQGRGTVDPDWADHSSGEEQLSCDSTEQVYRAISDVVEAHCCM